MDDTKRIISKQILVDTANAIRTKKGMSTSITPSNFADEIASIETQKPTQAKTAYPSTSQQVIDPDEGFNLAWVTVEAVTSSIDSNIKPQNIRKDVSILGVTGTYSDNRKLLTTESKPVLKMNNDTWVNMVWSGTKTFHGCNVWTDGDNIYFSEFTNALNYVLDKSTSTWSKKTWHGLTQFYGSSIWTDGDNIYYSNNAQQYVLDKSTSTWTSKTWNGLTNFNGVFIWSDGDNIYYSKNLTQYALDKSTSTWVSKTWNGIKISKLTGDNVWTDGDNIYYSYKGTSSETPYHRKLVLNKPVIPGL